MKTIFRIIPFVAAAFLSWSCDDQLSETPSSGYDKNDYFQNAERADMAILGIMSSISENNHYGQYEIAMPTSDDIYFTSRTQTDNGVNDISHYSYTSSNSWIEYLWRMKYQGIDRANTAISGIENMPDFDSDPELRALAGEARFLRAFLTFDIIKYWGEAPYTTIPTSDYESAFKPRVSTDSLYAAVTADLTRAIELMPWAEAGGSPERATRGAAHALLMRVMLQRAGYALYSDGRFERPSASVRRACFRSVIEQWEAFEANGYHGFYAGGYDAFFKDFSASILDNHESLWEVAMYMDQGRRNGSAWGIYIGPAVAQPTGLSTTEAASYMGRANAFFLVVPEWYDFYEESDVRRDVNICTYRYNWDSTNRRHVAQERARNSWYPGKWRREWMPAGQQNKNINYGDINFCPLRYADVVLMAAEAYNELGQTARAWELINRVRERAGATPLSTSNYQRLVGRNLAKVPVSYIDDSSEQGKIRMALYFERGYELCYEGQRKYDLIRWGVLDKALRTFAEATSVNTASNTPYQASRNFIHGQHELFPIPLREIQSNHALEGKNNNGF